MSRHECSGDELAAANPETSLHNETVAGASVEGTCETFTCPSEGCQLTQLYNTVLDGRAITVSDVERGMGYGAHWPAAPSEMHIRT